MKQDRSHVVRRPPGECNLQQTLAAVPGRAAVEHLIEDFLFRHYITQSVGAQQQPIQEKDSGGFGYGVLGFFFPFIGLILFLVLRESKPNTAKAAGIGALAGEITKVLLFILLIVIQITSVRMSMMP